MSVIHPQRRTDGREVIIHTPSAATPLCTWMNPSESARVTPRGALPDSLNELEFSCGAAQVTYWEAHADQASFDEPPFDPNGLNTAAGVVLVEPDQRVWIVHPTNQFAGYSATFPKGTRDPGRSLRATAVRECFEESALLTELTGCLGDADRTASRTRYYMGRRVGGNPADMGWESQAVSLVLLEMLAELLTSAYDQLLVRMLQQRLPLSESGLR